MYRATLYYILFINTYLLSCLCWILSMFCCQRYPLFHAVVTYAPTELDTGRLYNLKLKREQKASQYFSWDLISDSI